MPSSPSRKMDRKLERIRSGSYSPADFIIADAKDADMGGGIASAGPERDAAGQFTGHSVSMPAYRGAMKEMIDAGDVDIMLTSLSSAEALTAGRAWRHEDVTLAVRLNDSTDIWGLRGGQYRDMPALPIRTARIDRARAIADLGLYAVTFYNDRDIDVEALEAYAAFRDEAAEFGMRHFLEVFNPAFPIDTGRVELGLYINDAIVRCLAGVARADRPLFLKMQYNGPRAMEELAAYDPGNLIVGILGGGAGTTRDTLELVAQAERHGARIALFGRKIQLAEDPVEIVRTMRRVVERVMTPADAVRHYHDHLAKRGVAPTRPCEDDLQVTDPVLKSEA